MRAPRRRLFLSEAGSIRVRSGFIWLLILLAAGISIGIAAFTSTSTHESISQKARTIDRSLKCPSCNALSVWQSDAPTAVAVRHSVLHRLEEGQSPEEIKAYMVSRYGEDILLKPPDHGFDSLVWILPIAAVALGALGLGILFVKRAKDQEAPLDPVVDGPLSSNDDDCNESRPRHTGESQLMVCAVMARGTPERLAQQRLSDELPPDGYLTDTLSSLVHSIEDLEEEHASGELSQEDFERLLARYRARIEELLDGEIAGASPAASRSLARKVHGLKESIASGSLLLEDRPSRTQALRSSPRNHPFPRSSVRSRREVPKDAGEPTPKARLSRRTRWILGTVVLVALLVGGGIAIASRHSQPKLPGRPITGNVSLDRAQQIQRELTQAATLLNQGKDSTALYVYDKVLKLDPQDAAALVGSGWLMRVAGVQEHDSKLAQAGRERLEEAVKIDPSSAEARLLWATVLLQDKADPSGAAQQLEAFLRDHPSPGQLKAAREVAIPTYAELREPLPTAFSSTLN